MTEEQAIEYLIMKDIPMHVWQDWDKANKPRMVICTKSQLPSTRVWRNAWKINEELTIHNEKAA
jgi:protein-disulfide isomerase